MPHGQPNSCEYVIDGHPDGPTLLFIHGWPDDASLWRNQVDALAPGFRCVRVTLPNFGQQAVKAAVPETDDGDGQYQQPDRRRVQRDFFRASR